MKVDQIFNFVEANKIKCYEEKVNDFTLEKHMKKISEGHNVCCAPTLDQIILYRGNWHYAVSHPGKLQVGI